MEQPLSKPSVRFEVEKIVGISCDGSYQVQWAPAWVSKFHLVGCEHLIQEFLQEQSHRNVPPQQGYESRTLDLTCGKEGGQYNMQENAHQPNEANDNCGKGQPEMALASLENTTQLQQHDVGMLETCQESTLIELKTADICTVKELANIHYYPVNDHQDDFKTELPDGEMLDNSSVSTAGTADTTLDENTPCSLQHTQDTLGAVEVKVEEQEGETNTTKDAPTLVLLNSADKSSSSLEVHRSAECSVVVNELSHMCSNHEEGVSFNDAIAGNNDSVDNNDSDSLKKHVCTICQRRFRSKGHLRDHVATHTGVRPYTCAYRHCKGSFIQKSNLKEHIRRVHGAGKIPLQGAAPQTETALENSKKVNTKIVKKHVCSFCNRRFRNTSHLRDHILLHTGVRPFACEHCGKSFTQKCNLNKHLLIHTGERPYSCEGCGKKFIQKSALNYHLQKCPNLPPIDT